MVEREEPILSSSSLSTRLCWLALLLAPALLWGCLRTPFLHYDDTSTIGNEKLLYAESPWTEVFEISPSQPFYYPVFLLSLRLDRLLWAGTAPKKPPPAQYWDSDEATRGYARSWAMGIRLGNLFLHLGCAVLLWFIIRTLGGGEFLAGFIVIAWTLHPTACESISWAVERKNVLAAFFALATLLVWLRAGSARGRIFATVLYALAVFAKPAAVGIVAVICVWEILGRPRLQTETENIEPDASSTIDWIAASDCILRRVLNGVLVLLPTLLITVGVIKIGTVLGGNNVLPPPGGSIYTALLTDSEILVRYGINFFYPRGLSAFYAIDPIVSLTDIRCWIYGGSLTVFFLLTFWFTTPDKRRGWLFAWGWFIGALGANLNLVGISDLMHDRFVYLAAPGFWLVVALSLQGIGARLSAEKRRRFTRVIPLALTALALLLAYSTALRSTRFSSTMNLFTDAVQKEPRSSSAHLFLAKSLDSEIDKLQRQKKMVAEDQTLLRYYQDVRLGELQTGVAAPDFIRQYKPARLQMLLAKALGQRGEFAQARKIALRALHPQAVDSRPQVYSTVMSDVTRCGLNQILGLIALEQSKPRAAYSYLTRAFLLSGGRWTQVQLPRARALLQMAVQANRAGRKKRAAQFRQDAVAALLTVPPTARNFSVAQELLKTLELLAD